jgi:hypothetical protein
MNYWRARMNLYEKIQAVSVAIINIEKNSNVGGQYKAVADADVIAAVKANEKEFRLISIPFKQEITRDENIATTTSKGKAILMHSITIKMTTKIVDLDKPEDFELIESVGYGWDSGDKGSGKASTYARKYALLNAYKIITGEDPDYQKNEDLSPTGENDKITILKNLFEVQTKIRDNVFSNFGVGSVDDMRVGEVQITYDNLVKKKFINV